MRQILLPEGNNRYDPAPPEAGSPRSFNPLYNPGSPCVGKVLGVCRFRLVRGGSVRSVSCFAVCDFVLSPVGLSVSVYGGLVGARFNFLSCVFDFRC